MSEIKRTKEEELKEKSNFLRGNIKEDLKTSTTFFNEDNNKLLKFHGIYQQDNRDLRQKLAEEKKEKAYSCMIRTKLPGGKLTAKQYLALDELSEKFANKTLRITTRQTLQFHGIIKSNLRETVNEINKNLITTYGACGDVVRNVMASPVCDIDPDYNLDLGKIAEEISNYFLPSSEAYFEIWVKDENGEETKITKEECESIYGKTYLPRKFKIGIMLPEDNCVDIFTQDLGLIVIQNKNTKEIEGYNILIGGGLGHSHNKPETYPRLSSELCYISKDKLIEVCEKIVSIQRDFGGRENRKHARLKYLIDDKGLSWFKDELEKRLGGKVENIKPVEKYLYKDHLGWNKQTNDKWYLGIFIESGRILDKENKRLKTGLKKIIQEFNPEIRFTPQQNIILCNIEEENKPEINLLLEEYGFYIKEKNLSLLRKNSIACVSLPTCGLAIAEAERFLPKIIDKLESFGYGNEDISIRISGCPNSCSRAPASEIGIIGMSANKYYLYVGGDYHGTRLNKKIKEGIKGEDLAKEIAELIKEYKTNKKGNERFGDYFNSLK